MQLKKLNVFLTLCPILLVSLSYVTLLSTSETNARSQLVFFLVGVAGYIILAITDTNIYKSLWVYLQAVGVAFLAITFILGEAKFGSTRWINLGFFTLQPSEFIKITTILSIATIVSHVRGTTISFKTLFQTALVVIPTAVLILAQPDLGTAVVILAIPLVVFFYCGVNKWYFVILLMVLGIFSAPAWNLLQDYQRNRILVFLNPSFDTQGAGYNVIQSIVAVGSGGVFGKGYGRGTQTHQGFLPAYFTDFALAAFIEEWGFVGFMLFLIIYSTLFLTILYTAYKARSTYESVIAVSVFVVFFVQFIVNVGMNLGVMPVKGIPLPLFSYGGSSMLSSLFMLGLLQNIWMQRSD